MSEAPAEGTTPPEAASESQPTREDIDRLNAAITKERDLRKSAEKAAKDGKDASTRLAQIEEANASDIEKAVKAARDEATAAERTRTAGILAAAEARAQAADRFQNPATAVRLLELGDVRVSDEGIVDADGVKALLDALAESDPYLLKTKESTVPSPAQVGLGVGGGAMPQPTTPHGRLRASIQQDIEAGSRR